VAPSFLLPSRRVILDTVPNRRPDDHYIDRRVFVWLRLKILHAFSCNRGLIGCRRRRFENIITGRETDGRELTHQSCGQSELRGAANESASSHSSLKDKVASSLNSSSEFLCAIGGFSLFRGRMGCDAGCFNTLDFPKRTLRSAVASDSPLRRRSPVGTVFAAQLFVFTYPA
jgi:hypothetical protein